MENLNIMKDSIIESGEYNTIRVFANTEVTGSIKANLIEVYADVVFLGSVTVKNLKINGNAIINGPVLAMEITVNGTVIFNGDVKTNKLVIKNQVNAKSVKVESYQTTVDGTGYFHEFDGFELVVNNLFNCDLLLRCNKISFTENSRGKIGEIITAVSDFLPKNESETHRIYIDNILAYDVKFNQCKIRYLQTKLVDYDDSTSIDTIEYIKK